ncbi:MAG TPA: AAA family ATPase [Candidatus Limnocylindrales bacterium]|nr:AAA family ATPase [Candidatus Limnocylindrales bacterium]
MAASRILLAERPAAGPESIAPQLTAAGHDVAVATEPADVLRQVGDHEIVIIDRLAEDRAALELCRAIRAAPDLAAVPILGLTAADDVESRIAFLEAGADDVIARPFDDRELEVRLEALVFRFRRSKELAPTLAPSIIAGEPHRIAVVFAPKGGVGTTTIAVNLAMAKAKDAPDKVVVVDLDLQFGQVATFLDVTPRQTLADVVRDEQALREAELLRTFATRHDSGLHVLASPGSPESARLVEASHVEQLLKTILGTYDYVIVDAGSTLDERVMAAFERADAVILPVYPEIAALKALHSLLDYLNENGSVAGKTTFVLNNVFARELLKPRDVESSLGTRISFELPYDPFIYLKAVNEGRPVTVGAPRSLAAERFRQLAHQVFDTAGLVGAPAAPGEAVASQSRRGPRFALRRR